MPPNLKQKQLYCLLPARPPSTCLRCQSQQRFFSNTHVYQARKVSRARRAMFAWLEGPGAVYAHPRKGSTNYLSAHDKQGNLIRELEMTRQSGNDEEQTRPKASTTRTGPDGKPEKILPPETLEDLRPFPLNKFFRSEPVLSEALRDEVYRRVKEMGQTVREVSVTLSISIERVAAVYRMKEVERKWIEQGKPLHSQYQKTVLDMLPQTNYDTEATSNPQHESINDLPVHPQTLLQIFHPTSESRQFTRVDAGRVFHPDLLPADDRIPHPEMIEAAKDETQGFTQSERATRMHERFQEMQRAQDEKIERAKRADERHTKTVAGVRWDFKFRDAATEDAGPTGRGRRAVGWRYGQPVLDRKRSQVKIPTMVD